MASCRLKFPPRGYDIRVLRCVLGRTSVQKLADPGSASVFLCFIIFTDEITVFVSFLNLVNQQSFIVQEAWKISFNGEESRAISY